MAAELKTQFSLQYENGALKDQFEKQVNFDQATIGGPAPGYQIIGTSEEVIGFGDLVSPALVVMQNLDDTNFVTYGPESAGAMVPLGVIRPGGFAFFELAPSVTLRMQADTANVSMLIKAFEL